MKARVYTVKYIFIYTTWTAWNNPHAITLLNSTVTTSYSQATEGPNLHYLFHYHTSTKAVIQNNKKQFSYQINKKKKKKKKGHKSTTSSSPHAGPSGCAHHLTATGHSHHDPGDGHHGHPPFCRNFTSTNSVVVFIKEDHTIFLPLSASYKEHHPRWVLPKFANPGYSWQKGLLLSFIR